MSARYYIRERRRRVCYAPDSKHAFRQVWDPWSTIADFETLEAAERAFHGRVQTMTYQLAIFHQGRRL